MVINCEMHRGSECGSDHAGLLLDINGHTRCFSPAGWLCIERSAAATQSL